MTVFLIFDNSFIVKAHSELEDPETVIEKRTKLWGKEWGGPYKKKKK